MGAGTGAGAGAGVVAGTGGLAAPGGAEGSAMVPRNKVTDAEMPKKPCYTDDAFSCLGDCRLRIVFWAHPLCPSSLRCHQLGRIDIAPAHYLAFARDLHEHCGPGDAIAASLEYWSIHPQEVDLRLRAEDQGRRENSVTAKKSERPNIGIFRPMTQRNIKESLSTFNNEAKAKSKLQVS